MRVPYIVSLTAVVAITLWLGDASLANPTSGAEGSGARDEPGLSELVDRLKQQGAFDAGAESDAQEMPFKFTATQPYENVPSIVKCTRFEDDCNNELSVLRSIHHGGNDRKGKRRNKVPSSEIQSLFPSYPKTAVGKGYYCLIFNAYSEVTLKDYANKLDVGQRDKLLPGIFVQLITALKYMHSLGYVHGDITPWNIMIDTSSHNAPKVILTNFVGSHYVGDKASSTIEATFGYRSPEEYLKDRIDQYKRDSWMLGATLYTALTGKRAYGRAMRPNENPIDFIDEMNNLMKNVGLCKFHSREPVTTSKNEHLLELMDTLMECDPEKRPIVSKLDPSLLYKLAREKRVRTFLDQTWAKITSTDVKA
ncbi:kinase-like domain-containing protein [Thamnocephalis sphaerospora]|uniref:Kinase-like domain-containing protein n=1 Tax=Thamnocephalis sphaerospora TaxID=78915 RepID=A0A4P9XHU4_9FUNG|nr:kinase-like domain-containing protein [Thamnocephalis sphaerospora]|eukprot:RKP05273.1 kinase-like domain-containing protein [Thamnocephalis sphaerospora]